MSIETARAMLQATADYGSGDLQAYARRILETWAQPDAEAADRKSPKSGAERTRLWRQKRSGPKPDPVTVGDAAVTQDVTPGDAGAGKSSRALLLSSPSLSSSPDLSSSEPQDPGGSGGNARAREAEGNGAGEAMASPFSTANEESHFALEPTFGRTGVTTMVTNGDARSDGKCRRRDSAKGRRLPEDWKLSPELIAFAEGLGVDAHAIAEQFRDHWMAEGGAKAVKLDWDAAYRTWVRRAIKFGDAPSLPPAPPPPPPAGDAAKARAVLDVLSGNALPAILQAKEDSRHA